MIVGTVACVGAAVGCLITIAAWPLCTFGMCVGLFIAAELGCGLRELFEYLGWDVLPVASTGGSQDQRSLTTCKSR